MRPPTRSRPGARRVPGATASSRASSVGPIGGRRTRRCRAQDPAAPRRRRLRLDRGPRTGRASTIGADDDALERGSPTPTRALTDGLDGVHLSLAITGGSRGRRGHRRRSSPAPTRAWHSTSSTDRTTGAWRPPRRRASAVIAGRRVAARPGPTTAPELMLWAAGYAASTRRSWRRTGSAWRPPARWPTCRGTSPATQGRAPRRRRCASRRAARRADAAVDPRRSNPERRAGPIRAASATPRIEAGETPPGD